MQYDLLYQPSSALLLVRLDGGEEILGGAGAMVSASAGIRQTAGRRVGLLGGVKRVLLGNSDFPVDRFVALEAGEVAFASPYCGDLVHLHLDGQVVFVQSDAFVAACATIATDARWSGAHSFFTGDHQVLVKLVGSGDLWIAGYGAIHEKVLAHGERYLVDTGYVAAFEGSTEYDVRRSPGIRAAGRRPRRSLAEFSGPGRLWLQTRSLASLLDWLVPQLPNAPIREGD